MGFVRCFGFSTKTDFYNYVVKIDIAETNGTVKNRQDLFDPFFENPRKGWWQKGNTYIHRKNAIDNLFGKLDLPSFANIVKLFMKEKFGIKEFKIEHLSPILKSRFKQLQLTGMEAEEYFLNNYTSIEAFKTGIIEDARMFGDGYDFQIDLKSEYNLVEIKGIKNEYGGFRFTEKEYCAASEYKNQYALVVVSNLIEAPRFNIFFDPTAFFQFDKKTTSQIQTTYHVSAINWKAT